MPGTIMPSACFFSGLEHRSQSPPHSCAVLPRLSATMPRITHETILAFGHWSNQLDREPTDGIGADRDGWPRLSEFGAAGWVEIDAPHIASAWCRRYRFSIRQCRRPES